MENNNDQDSNDQKSDENEVKIDQNSPKIEEGKKALLRNKAILVPNQRVTRRKAYSSCELFEGDLVFTEKPIVWVARSICSSEICHNCFKDIKTAKTYQCNSCLNSYYCSKKCEGESKDIHKYECPLLMKDKIAKLNKFPIHEDIIRLFFRVLSSRTLEKTKKLIEDLREESKSYKSKYPKQMLTAFSEVSKEITSMINDDKIKIPIEEMIEIFCCLHSSSYGFKSSTWNTDVALGLLHYHSYVSHSCKPNCAFVNNNDTMELRAITNINEKEELHVSYIDLYQTREERIKKLRFSKFVKCKCERCKEPMEKSKDRFLEAFLCNNVNPCKGLFLINSTVNQEDKKNPDRDIFCTDCKSSRKLSEMNNDLANASKLFTQMVELYQTNKPLRAIKIGEKLETTYANIFHPMHYILFNTSCILINCHDISQNVAQSSVYSKKVIKCLEFIFPDEKYWEVSNYLYHLGCAYYEMSIKEKNVKKAQELKKLCKEAFMKSYGIRKICCGVEHPDTKIVLSKI